MPTTAMPRSAGVLLHMTSLPGPGSNGELGPEAYRFVDWLHGCGFGIWQMLPIGPPASDDGSPYQSTSAMAGDVRFIAPEPLIELGWLEAGAMDDPHDLRFRDQLIARTFSGFKTSAGAEDHQRFSEFCAAHAYWLDDYILFQALHEEYRRGWWEWPDALRRRTPQALAEARARLATELECRRFAQFLFHYQWTQLRSYANDRGIRLFGDVPIFVAHHSAEVWAHPDIFFLNAHGEPDVVAGVPPDYFSETGQRWGNPLYRWDRIAEQDYAFWIERIGVQLERFDLLRIDHFRGFEAYWEIPASEPNAIKGRWVPGPGDQVFEALRAHFGELPLVAEDLGIVTDQVTALRERQGMPGMKILQFAFSRDADNPYLPAHHGTDAVVYTGTHDNDTTLGWFHSLSEEDQGMVYEVLGHPPDAMPWALIETAFASTADTAIVPLQDLLELGAEARMNVPGTVEGNWRWRFDWAQVGPGLAGRVREMLAAQSRLAPVGAGSVHD